MTYVPVPSLLTAVLFNADTEQAMPIAAIAVVLILVFLTVGFWFWRRGHTQKHLSYVAAGQPALREREHAKRLQRKMEQGFQFLFINNPLPMWVFDLKTLCFLQVNELLWRAMAIR